MNIQLTQKETLLLEDQKSHEELCIAKYQSYAEQAQDPQLKQLFLNHAAQEQEHLDSINQLLSGKIPNTKQKQGQQNQQNQQTQEVTIDLSSTGSDKDALLCQDLLMTEKYISDTYDTTIFEFTNAEARKLLNHIQKEEQQHGEDIFNYMQQHGMYQTK